MAVTTERTKSKKTAPNPIPAQLVYETLADGIPVYYKGYKEYLSGTKTAEALMGSSYLQGIIISKILRYLYTSLPDTFEGITNELGLQYSKKGWHASDIVIYEKSALPTIPSNDKYMPILPRIVIEVDTKASFEDFTTPMDYFNQKTDDLLNFGVEKVIWIFTASRKVMEARKGENWIISGWQQEIPLLENISLNLEKLIQENNLK
jgi:Uma2 family endonuclease